MKRRFQEVGCGDADEATGADWPRSRATGFTDQELESRFSKHEDAEQLMDEETVRRLLRKQRREEEAAAFVAAAKAEQRASAEAAAEAVAAEKAAKHAAAEAAKAKEEETERRRSQSFGFEATPTSKPESFAPPASFVAQVSCLSCGDFVVVKGLKAAAHLNGLRGRLGPFDEATGRWEVTLVGSGEAKAIKPDNIEPFSGANHGDVSAEEMFVVPTSPERDPPIAPRSPPPSRQHGASESGRSGCGVAGLSSASFAQQPVPGSLRSGGSSSSSTKQRTTTRRQGTVRWYNGRRKIGKVMPDGGGEDLFIPAQGALNGSQVPPQPGGLFHGTRVSYMPVAIDKPSTPDAVKSGKMVCMDVRPLPGQVGLSAGVDSNIGAKEKNDDRIAACDLHELGFFAGVFDGHRGHLCADYIAKNLPAAVLSAYRSRVKREGPGGVTRLSNADEATLISNSIVDAFEATDKAFIVMARKKEIKDGSTGVVGLVAHGFESHVLVPKAGSEEVGATALWAKVAKKLGQDVESTPSSPSIGATERSPGTVACAAGGVAKLFVAWCGDSRAVLIRGRQGLRLTEDHKPNRKDERERIQRAGGFLGKDAYGIWRVGPKEESKLAKELQKFRKKDHERMRWFLSTSRAFGDYELKAPDPIVVSTPEVKVVDLAPEDWAVVLACDGVLDVLSDQQVANVVYKTMGLQGKDPVATAKAVVQTALTAGSKDNITAIVMRFGWTSPPRNDEISGPNVFANAPFAGVDAQGGDDDMFG